MIQHYWDKRSSPYWT